MECQKLAVVILLLSLQIEAKIVSEGDGDWTHQVNLEEDYGIRFRWRNFKDDTDEPQKWILMEFAARASGYVGVGFSPHGGMAGGDMAIAWEDSDGSSRVMDFHGIDNGPPIQDSKQDYTLLSFQFRDGWTTFTFKRRWDTCDSSDMLITNDTMRLIWAYSDSKPEMRGGNFYAPYHGTVNRGARSVILADGGAYPPFPDEKPDLYPGAKIWDFRMDKAPVEPKNTTYYCKIVKFTDSSKKHHMIGWKPLIQKENRNIVHHIVVFECRVPEDEVLQFDRYHASHPGGTCYTPNMPAPWGRNCVSFSLAWVVGSEGEMLPDHVGNPLGEEHGGATYFMVEMHYENPGLHTTKDSSGIRIFYTDQLRQYDGGMMLVGYRHSPFLLIPPNQNNFMIHGVCGSECTSKMIPPSGIQISNTLVHLHLAGKKIRLRHFRNGIELPIIAEDNHYDFNYQQSRSLKNELIILPGDELITECEYQTKNVDRYVIGGLATNQEMCQVFFFYYPRIPLSQCTSQYEFHDFLRGLHVDAAEGDVLKPLNMPYQPELLPPEDREKDLADDARELEAIEEGISFKGVFNYINITLPTHLRGKTVGKWLEEIKWSDTNGKELERYWKYGKQYQFCSKPGLKRVILDEHIIHYPKITKAIKKEKSAVCQKEHILQKSAGLTLTSKGYHLTLSLTITLLTLEFFK